MLKLLLGYIREISGTWLPKKRVCLAVCVWKESYEYVDSINNGQVEDIYISIYMYISWRYACAHICVYTHIYISWTPDWHIKWPFVSAELLEVWVAQNSLGGKGWKIFQSRKVTLTDPVVWGLPPPPPGILWVVLAGLYLWRYILHPLHCRRHSQGSQPFFLALGPW